MNSLNWKLFGFMVLPNTGVIIGELATKANSSKWCASLKTPSWTPPEWVIGAAWGSVYSGIGYASYLVYRDGDGWQGAAKLPLAIYGANVLANWAWAPLFYAARNIKLALLDLQVINVTALGMAYHFYEINPVAGYLVAPYCLWLCVANALNYALWRDNKGQPETTNSGPRRFKKKH